MARTFTGKILVVDDSKTIRTQVSQMIGEGPTVLEAGDGEKALEVLMANKDTRLILSDVNMPLMNGLVMAEKIAQATKEGVLPKIPLIMITTENTVEKVEQAKKFGVLGWIIKPLKHEQLTKIIEKFAS